MIQHNEGCECRECQDGYSQVVETKKDSVNHPQHYGGENNVYEAIKVIEAWGLDFCLGNVLKYICRAGEKSADTELTDLKKARWYLQRRIEQLEKQINTL